MHSMSYDDVKSNISNSILDLQDQLNTENYAKHTKEQLESQISVYQYVDELADMNYHYNSGY